MTCMGCRYHIDGLLCTRYNLSLGTVIVSGCPEWQVQQARAEEHPTVGFKPIVGYDQAKEI